MDLTINPTRNQRLNDATTFRFLQDHLPTEPAKTSLASYALPLTSVLASMLVAGGAYKGARAFGLTQPLSFTAAGIGGAVTLGGAYLFGGCNSLLQRAPSRAEREAWAQWELHLQAALQQTDYAITWNNTVEAVQEKGRNDDLIVDARAMLEQLTTLSTSLHEPEKWDAHVNARQTAVETLALMASHARGFIDGIGNLNAFRKSETEKTALDSGRQPESEDPYLAQLAQLKSNFMYLEEVLVGGNAPKMNAQVPTARDILELDLTRSDRLDTPAVWVADASALRA